MELRRLGTSGLQVSSVALGTLTWGRDTDEHEAREQFEDFLESGGTLIDTADVYGDGRSEQIIGRLLAQFQGEDVVIATKAGGVRRQGRAFDTSRRHLLKALDESLGRLGVESIDIWHVHGFDAVTPIDETLNAITAAVDSGRVRYAAISNWPGWATGYVAGAMTSSVRPVVAAQVEYSLLARGVEREVLPAVTGTGLGVLAWSPLGRGVLTGKYRGGMPADSRGASAHLAAFVAPYLDERGRRITEAVVTAAEGLGVTPLDVALAWVRQRVGVCSAIVGARTAHQLRGALARTDLVLPWEIMRVLDEISAPERGYPDAGWPGA